MKEDHDSGAEALLSELYDAHADVVRDLCDPARQGASADERNAHLERNRKAYQAIKGAFTRHAKAATPASTTELTIAVPVSDSQMETLDLLALEAGYETADYLRIVALAMLMPEGMKLRRFEGGMTTRGGVPNQSPQLSLEAALEAVKRSPPSREHSLVATKIEEALMWLRAASEWT